MRRGALSLLAGLALLAAAGAAVCRRYEGLTSGLRNQLRYGTLDEGRNVSAMTVGDFRREVPAKYLLRTPFVDAFYGAEAKRRQLAHADLRFVDRARELGVENFGTGRGVAVEDFDGDGYLDVVATGSF